MIHSIRFDATIAACKRPTQAENHVVSTYLPGTTLNCSHKGPQRDCRKKESYIIVSVVRCLRLKKKRQGKQIRESHFFCFFCFFGGWGLGDNIIQPIRPVYQVEMYPMPNSRHQVLIFSVVQRFIFCPQLRLQDVKEPPPIPPVKTKGKGKKNKSKPSKYCIK